MQILGSAGSTGRDTEALDTLHLMILRANWLVKWASCITNTTSSGGATSSEETGRAFRQRTLDALTLYKECSAGAAAASHQTSAAAATAATSTTTRAQLNSLQNQLCTSFTLHCDNLLQCFESAHAAGGSTDAATASLAQEFLVQEHASKKDARAQAAVLTVQSFVQGLRLGNGYCIQRVLRLVQIIGAYPEETEHILRSQLASLPAWVFLQFAAQLMGSLDRPEGAIICSLLEHTAAAFPTALYYPFRITSEFLGVKGRERSAKLGLMLRNSSQDAFIEALNGLTHPEHRWNDGMKEIHQIFLGATGASAAAVDEGTKLRVAAAYQKLRRCTLETDWLSVGGKIGTYNRKWARSARPIADKFAGAQGEKLVSKKAFDALRQAIINADLCEITQHGGGKVALSEFSQWLCDFDPLTCHIEIPGQYSNMSAAAAATAGGGDSVCYGAPRAAVHEAIVAVDPSLLAMSSIRKPKRIKLYGSAGGQHYFLVKGGEDLRNDERVQQLFHLMNTVVAAGMDSNVKQQQAQASCAGSLKARTYAVIPMTSQVVLHIILLVVSREIFGT